MKYLSQRRKALLLAVVAASAGLIAQAEDLKQDFIASGVTAKVGGYRPLCFWSMAIAEKFWLRRGNCVVPN